VAKVSQLVPSARLGEAYNYKRESAFVTVIRLMCSHFSMIEVLRAGQQMHLFLGMFRIKFV
jgi:hypothetical protein